MPHAFNKNFTGHAGVMQGFFGGGGSAKKCNHDWSITHKKQVGICIKYTCISEVMLWLHHGKFAKIKWVKIPSLAVL